MTPILELNEVTLTRGGVPLIQDVSLTGAPREHWLVFGPNGCGKSTLLKLISGYLHPGKGQVRTLPDRGLDREGWFDLRRHIGIVSHGIAQRIDPDQSALEIVASGEQGIINHWGDVPEDLARRACLHLGALGAESIRHKPWEILSQGERQKALIARALIPSPKLLVLDEPCTGLDFVARRDLLDHLQQLRASPTGPATLLVTHEIGEITPDLTHALLLKAGKVHARGPLPDAFNSDTLTRLFDTPLKLIKSQDAYYIEG